MTTVWSRAALTLFLGTLGLNGRCLTIKEAERLVTNLPVALTIKRHGGCLTPDYQRIGPNLALVQLRNTCPRSGSGLIGNYVVDLRSGRIWSDMDQKAEVDSAHVRALRRKLLSSAGVSGDCAPH